MTKQEYENQGWGPNMKAIYWGKEYSIDACNFPEYLIGLGVDDSDDLIWVRCENIELVEAKQN